MAGGGRVIVKGGVAEFREAEVIDGALVVTAIGGLPGGGGSFQWNFFGEDNRDLVEEIDLHGTNDVVPIAKAIQTGAVAVRFRHRGFTPPVAGPWTLRLLRNGVQVATFTVNTS